MTYTVFVQPDNLLFFVEAGETILEAALRQGFDFNYGCQLGSCGTCAAILLQGNISYPLHDPIGLEDDEIAANYILLCSAVPESDLIIQAPQALAPWPVRTQKLAYRVAEMQDLSPTVIQLILEPPEDQPIYFSAGQYIEVYIPNGDKRPYSIANAPVGGKHIELHIRHTADNFFATQLLNSIAEKQMIWIEGPYGRTIYRVGLNFPLIFLAGGTGFSHSKALIEQAIQKEPTRPMHLFWGAKTPADLYMNELPLLWQNKLPNFNYTPTISRPDGRYDWQGHTLSLPKLITEFYPDLNGYYMYASGPPSLVMDALSHVEQHGLRREFFGSDALPW